MNNISDDQSRSSPPPTPPTEAENPPLKRVRIALPPSPPLDMQKPQQSMPDNNRLRQRTSLSSVQSGERVVLPTDKVDEGDQHNQLRSGSKWRQHDLALLKVKFEPDEDVELPMLDVEHEWTLSQCQRISYLSCIA